MLSLCVLCVFVVEYHGDGLCQVRPGVVKFLRTAALIAVVAGAAGSISLMLRAGHPPLFLRVLFAIWVLSPFVLLVWAAMVSKRWTALTQTALYGVMLVVALGSVAVYGADALWPRKSQPAFFYVLVPPVSWLIFGVVPIAALISRRRSPTSPRAPAGG